MDPVARLGGLRGVVPFDCDAAVLVESWSNDTWLTGDAVLRVCWRGDRDRLSRERQLLEALPGSIPHASVVDAGEWADGTWIVLRRIPGQRMDLVWGSLTSSQQERAVRRMGEVLRLLHQWTPPRAIRELLACRTSTEGRSPDDVAGSALVPWPRSLLSALLPCLEVPLRDHLDLQGTLARRARDLGSVVTEAEFDGSTVVHGDAHAANVLCDSGALVALLDFEWARLGPADLELEAICRDDPVIEAHADDGGVVASEVPVMEGLRETYPELFQHDDLTERLWLYQLCHEVRSVVVREETAVSERQLRRLRSIATRPWVRFS